MIFSGLRLRCVVKKAEKRSRGRTFQAPLFPSRLTRRKRVRRRSYPQRMVLCITILDMKIPDVHLTALSPMLAFTQAPLKSFKMPLSTLPYSSTFRS